VRQALRKLIAAIGADEQDAAAMTVATGEAVNNAIEHAYGITRGVVRVRARYDGVGLRVDVEDEGAWRPGRAADGGGHGLALMRALVDTVDVVTSPTGTTVSLTAAIRSARTPPDEVQAAASAPRPAQPGASREPGDRNVTAGTPSAEAPPRRAAIFDIGEFDRIPVLSVSGDLDIGGAEVFRAALERAARTDSAAVIVSLAGASYIDSHSIRALFHFGRRLATNRRSLVLAVPPVLPFNRILHVSGLDRAFRVETSVERALAGVARPIAPPAPTADDA
jgi:anti-anti-sigma factor